MMMKIVIVVINLTYSFVLYFSLTPPINPTHPHSHPIITTTPTTTYFRRTLLSIGLKLFSFLLFIFLHLHHDIVHIIPTF